MRAAPPITTLEPPFGGGVLSAEGWSAGAPPTGPGAGGEEKEDGVGEEASGAGDGVSGVLGAGVGEATGAGEGEGVAGAGDGDGVGVGGATVGAGVGVAEGETLGAAAGDCAKHAVVKRAKSRKNLIAIFMKPLL